MPDPTHCIRLRGVRQNNLKNLNLDLPLGELLVVTGVSGSGKSSLAFDTIYAEGQRRYVETFSPYARQFLDRMDPPLADRIEGIPPAIAIEQTNKVRTSRSTVGTMTELTDHLKLLFARAARLFCHGCGREVRRDTPESIWAQLATPLSDPLAGPCARQAPEPLADQAIDPSPQPGGSPDRSDEQVTGRGADRLRQSASQPDARVLICFRVEVPEGLSPSQLKDVLAQQGFIRFLHESDSELEVIQDRLRLTAANRNRALEALEAALEHGRGQLRVYPVDANRQPGPPRRFSRELHCPDCAIRYRDPIPSLFSFNSPVGACETCRGFGRIIGIDWDLVVPDGRKSLLDGAVKPIQSDGYAEVQEDLIAAAHRRGIPTDVPWAALSDADRHWVLDGDPGRDAKSDEAAGAAGVRARGRWYGIRGFFDWLEGRSYKMHVRVLLSRYRRYDLCPDCQGARLKDAALDFRIGDHALADAVLERSRRFRHARASLSDQAWLGLPGLNLHDLMQLPISAAARFFEGLRLSRALDQASGALDQSMSQLLATIRARLRYLNEVGLGYLTLDRQSRTLSGGETQRINLTTALGSALVNTLFVLDEPSVGLHPRDIGRMLGILQRLRDGGNSLLVVEHDPLLMCAADRLLDIGPGPGEHGGELVYFGTLKGLFDEARSATGAFLSGRRQVASARVPRPLDRTEPMLRIRGARAHNLKGIDLELPLQRLVVVTGVSGSGKSTLVQQVLFHHLAKQKGHPEGDLGDCDAVEGAELIDDVLMVDQSPIGRSSRSNPASYVGALDPLRKRFAATPLAIERGYKAGHFSFNAGAGRCPTCAGSGFEHVEMQFLSDVYLRCPDCAGRRYKAELLEVRLPPPASRAASATGEDASIPVGADRRISIDLTQPDSAEAHEPLMSGAGTIAPDRQQLGCGEPASDLLARQAGDLAAERVPEPSARSRVGAATDECPAPNIADVLAMTVSEALAYFVDDAEMQRSLQPLVQVGLDYLRLGQPVPTLSGGEAQRLKLAGHLAKTGRGRRLRKGHTGRLFLFDEPTAGLHLADTAQLLQAFQRLLDAGHSLVVIEHNTELMLAADWLIDLGPEGGTAGGALVACGTPESIAAHPSSHTGQALREVLKARASAADDSNPTATAEQTRPAKTAPTAIGETAGNWSAVAHAAPAAQQAPAASSALRMTDHPPRSDDEPPIEAERQAPAEAGCIQVRHAREHNLKDLTLAIPRDRFVVITGVSGSGKSTLAFDILFAEGQRRYLESLNAYARQFVQPAARADVDAVLGLPPTVAIEQRTSRGGHKSTVGTLTELHHFLRLLFMKLGTQHCPACQVAISPRSRRDIRRLIAEQFLGQPIRLLAPVVIARKGIYRELAEVAERHGAKQVLIDGELLPATPWPSLDRFKEHSIDLLLPPEPIDPTDEATLSQALDQTLALGRGLVRVAPLHAGGPNGAAGAPDLNAIRTYSTQRTCPDCGVGFDEPDPRLFSYNSKHGWCPSCYGTGLQLKGFDDEQTGEEGRWSEQRDQPPCPACQGQRLRPEALAVRFRERSIAQVSALSVTAAEPFFRGLRLNTREAKIASDLLPDIQGRLGVLLQLGLGYLTLDRAAPTLSGGEAQRIRLAAQLGSNLRGVCYILDEPSIGLHARDNARLLQTLSALQSKGNSLIVVEHDAATMRCADEIIDLGPGAGAAGGQLVARGTAAALAADPRSLTGRYLARSTAPAADAMHDQAQRNLAQPTDATTRDNERSPQASTLAPRQQAIGPTDRLETTDADRADRSPDVPGATRTAGAASPPAPSRPPATDAGHLSIRGACLNNLKRLDLAIPLGQLVCVTGVSGSGKSTLVRDVLGASLKRLLAESAGTRRDPNAVRSAVPGRKAGANRGPRSGPSSRSSSVGLVGCRALSGWQRLARVLEVDQTPIGKTPRSCPATYIGIWDRIRRLYASAPEARMLGWGSGRFSFNTGGGRCSACEGQGVERVEMSFLPDVKLTCEVCDGSRFNAETRRIQYLGMDIGQVLAMNADAAVEHFHAHPAIRHPLELLQAVGLGYLALGQASPTLSGGEAQRLKLVTELAKAGPSAHAEGPRRIRPTLYLLDEPTVGLHMADTERLIAVLRRLVDAGHSVIVIEHDLDLIAAADWLIDLGPEAGDAGGQLVAAGPPIEIADSATGPTPAATAVALHAHIAGSRSE